MIDPATLAIIHRHWDWAAMDPVPRLHVSGESAAVEISPVHVGFSGSLIYRIVARHPGAPALNADENTSIAFALKAWPTSTPASRVAEVHRRVLAATPHCEWLATPIHCRDRRSTFVTMENRHWEMTRWIDGKPLVVGAREADVQTGAEAIAILHEALADDQLRSRTLAMAADKGNSFSSLPSSIRCIDERTDRLNQLRGELTQIQNLDVTVDALANRLSQQVGVVRGQAPLPLERDYRELARLLMDAQQRLRRCWAPVIVPLQHQLRYFQSRAAEIPVTWVLRDVHREHILFGPVSEGEDGDDAGAGGNQVRGVLDYDAMSLDSPAVDVARWAGSFTLDPVISLATSVAGYRQIRAFSALETELAQTLVSINAVGGLGNWLVWLILENRQFVNSPLELADRISHLIASVCRIC